MGAVAKRIGLPLLPWQRLVLGVALETQRGRPAYRDVLISVPRQSGKSSLALALLIWRMLQEPGASVIYGAQSRLAARQKLLLSWWPRLAASELGGRFTLSRAYGAEMLACDNDSTLQLLASREAAGHGETCDLAVLDEAWVHLDAAVEQAIRPALVTRRAAQLWIVSTAGTARSAWWRAKLDAGIAAAEMGVTDGLACFDWSAPDGANPADESTWWGCMPGLGRLSDARTVRTDMQNMDLGEFCRAYLNQWPDPAGEGWELISEAAWNAAKWDVEKDGELPDVG